MISTAPPTLRCLRVESLLVRLNTASQHLAAPNRLLSSRCRRTRAERVVWPLPLMNVTSASALSYAQCTHSQVCGEVTCRSDGADAADDILSKVGRGDSAERWRYAEEQSLVISIWGLRGASLRSFTL